MLECVTKAENFFKVHLPELLAKWYSRKMVMPDHISAASVVTEEHVYLDKGSWKCPTDSGC